MNNGKNYRVRYKNDSTEIRNYLFSQEIQILVNGITIPDCTCPRKYHPINQGITCKSVGT
ncbi:hypothetical protein DLD82_04030 [Methanospirillum stamsii]|uniref:Uncharacterized protein n=1 Tax=Methanospirillum stamsii TaxID=1277351 RepID=A0A2V2NH96_9EURY|nr:hypothetical protein DLD82_04030 [Methanospirillum stamsii]